MKYALTFLVFVLLAVPAYGKNNGHNKQQNKQQHEYEYEHEHRYESDHKQKEKHKAKKKYRKHKKNQGQGLPPGLQKKGAKGKDLPPGWQKKIKKGKRVDDELYKHMRPCDRETLRHLPPLQPGEYYKAIDDDIIKLRKSSREILDVIKRSTLPPPPPPPFF